jgi:hypothetical protein
VQVDNAQLKSDVKPETPLTLMNTGLAAQKFRSW